MKIPPATHGTQKLIDSTLEDYQDGPRPHMGCSLLGHHCDRYLWLVFRLAVIEKFSGRMLRLFRRGQNEEETVLSDMRRSGIDITKTQLRVDFGCHIGGSLDGLINRGLPEALNVPHILEIKTHNEKSFNDLEKKGVKESKPQHYVQMQLYMKGVKIDRALYYAVCKNDDRLHIERIRYDKKLAKQYLKRGKRIVLSNSIPERISENKSWYQCKMCGCHDFCHGSRLTKEVNCRTCCHSTALKSGSWKCEIHKAKIPFDFQVKGCDEHVLRPDLVPWERVEKESNTEATYIINGTKIRNGTPDAFVFGSTELIANSQACIDIVKDPDGEISSVRKQFDARIY